MYDPIKRTKQLEKFAVLNEKRKYYRFRGAKWYGWIATADVVVCNLLCKFCWAGDEIRNFPNKVGKFYTPKEVFNKLGLKAKETKPKEKTERPRKIRKKREVIEETKGKTKEKKAKKKAKKEKAKEEKKPEKTEKKTEEKEK